jgi:small subunit ribosomal protein S18
MPPRKRTGRVRTKEMRSRPRRRKVSPVTTAGVNYVDYKDAELLRAFVSERAKIRAQRVSGNNRQQQREVARAIKTAREMALIEYARRPMTQRRGDKRRGQRPGDERRPPAHRAGEPARDEQGHGDDGVDEHPDAAVGQAPTAVAGEQA